MGVNINQLTKRKPSKFNSHLTKFIYELKVSIKTFTFSPKLE